ncbi:hypothetical protein TIFTF001_005297 [Ficus carica]|uniref:Uncharacterized protein n=1 Tax=Ficus carica TaxID=3494 RepID=A0AA87ZNB3_FICCA|nr:hypothetical protein TIFTF001_005297 [Ficus carica]
MKEQWTRRPSESEECFWGQAAKPTRCLQIAERETHALPPSMPGARTTTSTLSSPPFGTRPRKEYNY